MERVDLSLTKPPVGSPLRQSAACLIVSQTVAGYSTCMHACIHTGRAVEDEEDTVSQLRTRSSRGYILLSPMAAIARSRVGKRVQIQEAS